MTVTVKSKTPLVVPDAIRRKAGFRSGDKIEFKVSGGMIHILPKLPSADDEYTPEQRRAIDARLAESEAELRQSRGFGPFSTAEEMIASMKAELKKTASRIRPKRSE